jgi:hypothetical protein
MISSYRYPRAYNFEWGMILRIDFDKNIYVSIGSAASTVYTYDVPALALIIVNSRAATSALAEDGYG